MTAPRPINEGSAFDPATGKLYRFHSGGEGSIDVLRFWPEPQAWQLRRPGGWTGGRPFLDIDRILETPRGGPLHRRWKLNQQAALAQVPAAVLAALKRLPPAVQWDCLRLFGRSEGGLELAASNAALLVGLACARRMGIRVQRPLRSARSLLRRPRADIAAWLGFEGRKATVGVLSRFAPEDCHPVHLRELRTLLKLEPRTLWHLPRITAPVVELLLEGDPRDSLSPSLLRECASQRALPGLLATNQVRTLQARLQALRGDRPIPRLTSLAQVEALHAELDADSSRARHRELHFPSFPPPPFPAVRLPEQGLSLSPLTCYEELRWAGKQDHNCLGEEQRYPLGICNGRVAVYRVRWSEDAQNLRALLHLRRSRAPGAPWEIRELLAPCNEPVPRGILGHVRGWVDAEHRASDDWKVLHPPTHRWLLPRPSPPPSTQALDPRQLDLPLGWSPMPWDGDLDGDGDDDPCPF